ncbi:hypothetical protein [Anaeropeptidivorans aminofermentans]|uniref:hypothetical protein n=1 Tax=Anaeropeptidivorans aminofermentans TaxID=2934315 RepID=UPI0038CC0FDC
MGWKRIPAWDGWAALLSPDESIALAFQKILSYTSPAWPWEAEKQMRMVHFELFADNMEEVRILRNKMRCQESGYPAFYDFSHHDRSGRLSFLH